MRNFLVNNAEGPSLKFGKFEVQLLVVATIMAFLALLLKLAIWFSGVNLWDDSFMFARYAYVFIKTGQIAWNLHGQPTYGLTSPLYLVAIIPLRLLLGYHPPLVVFTASFMFGVIFLGLIYVLIWGINSNKSLKSPSMLLVFFVLAASSKTLSVHFVSGMETMFMLCYLTIYIMAIRRLESYSSTSASILVGLLGGLAFYARPGLMLFTILAPLAVLLFSSNSILKRKMLISLVITLVVLGAELIINSVYFKSPLPLAFYAKSMNLYGASFKEKYQNVPFEQLLLYLQSYWFLFVVIVINLLMLYRQNKAGWTAADYGFFAGVIGYIVYYLFFVTQVMYYGARFYYGTLPVLCYLGAKSINNLTNSFSDKKLVYFKIACVLILPVSLIFAVQNIVDNFGSYRTVGIFKLHDVYKSSNWSYQWYKLDQFSTLPSDLVIATTEVGAVSVFNPNKKVVDLAGLNKTNISRDRSSIVSVIKEKKPDIIFGPHPDYRDMVSQLSQSKYVNTNYRYYRIPSSLAIAVRKDSKYFRKMKKIIGHSQRYYSISDAYIFNDKKY